MEHLRNSHGHRCIYTQHKVIASFTHSAAALHAGVHLQQHACSRKICVCKNNARARNANIDAALLRGMCMRSHGKCTIHAHRYIAQRNILGHEACVRACVCAHSRLPNEIIFRVSIYSYTMQSYRAVRARMCCIAPHTTREFVSVYICNVTYKYSHISVCVPNA